jgi:general secretion pathway protein G
MSHLPVVPVDYKVSRHPTCASSARRSFRARSRRRARGFTLIEIMVVVIIIALLAAVIVPNIMGHVDDAKITAAKEDIVQLKTALKFYYLDNSKYPTTEQGLRALVTQPNDSSITHWRQYIEGGLKKDPWGRDYLYQYPGTHGEPYDLYTLGSDGQPGGEGPAADIGNWAPEQASN